jgi:hypothetical protein
MTTKPTPPPDLLRAVLDDVDSDDARRAYGEWAKARPWPDGDPDRGSLIDVQLELARQHREQAGIAGWGPPYRRAEELLAGAGYRWRAPLEPLVDARLIPATNPKKLAYEFRRGFVEHVEMDARAFADHAPRVFATTPVRFVTLSNVMAHPQVLASPHLRQIAALHLEDDAIDDAALALLAGSPHARRLRWLACLPNNRITQRGIETIAASHLRALLFFEPKSVNVDPIDRYSSEGERVITTWRTELGRDLERRFGVQPWLHAPWYFNLAFPPDFENAADSQPATDAEYAALPDE